MNLRRRREKENVDINLISLIDVLLFLVIFFMVSTTFVERAQIALTLPKASTEPSAAQQDKVEIAIDPAGRYYVNNKALINTQLATLKHAIAETTQGMKDPAVMISADAKTAHQAVVIVLDAARQLGLMRITFVTALLPENP
jgi:biopolymer transport protein ExbD